jgi:glycerophosphoryl diester phosphodiesterase
MTIVVGHRAAGVSETTISSFQEALDLGIEMIEFDLRLTGDNQLVVFHGPYGMEGKNILRGKKLADLKSPNGFVPPLFSDVVDLCQGKIRFDIEIKEFDILLIVLEQLGSREGHIITSFLDPVVLQAKQSGITAGLVLGMAGITARQRLSELFPKKRKKNSQADFLVPHFKVYRTALNKQPFHDCFIWGANSDQEIRKLLADNRVQGIITDHPAKAEQLKTETD